MRDPSSFLLPPSSSLADLGGVEVRAARQELEQVVVAALSRDVHGGVAPPVDRRDVAQEGLQEGDDLDSTSLVARWGGGRIRFKTGAKTREVGGKVNGTRPVFCPQAAGSINAIPDVVVCIFSSGSVESEGTFSLASCAGVAMAWWGVVPACSDSANKMEQRSARVYSHSHSYLAFERGRARRTPRQPNPRPLNQRDSSCLTI